MLAEGAPELAMRDQDLVISPDVVMPDPCWFMADVCCGLKGASAAARDSGWSVLTVDIDPRFEADITIDVRNWHYIGPSPDLAWFSPPCDEFSRESMPWCKPGKTPDTSIVLACKRLIAEMRPRYFAIENVKGSQPYINAIFGPRRQIIGPVYLWGFFPQIAPGKISKRKKESMSSSRAAERALIPYEISAALIAAVESQAVLL